MKNNQRASKMFKVLHSDRVRFIADILCKIDAQTPLTREEYDNAFIALAVMRRRAPYPKTR